MQKKGRSGMLSVCGDNLKAPLYGFPEQEDQDMFELLLTVSGIGPKSAIGVVEVLKVGQQIIGANRKASPNAAFGVYLTIFLLYFLLCWPISLLAKRLEKRWG